MNLPFSEAAAQNREVILDAIRPHLHGEVLEIGSGTGQHAVFFASQLPQLRWQCSDLAPGLPGIAARIEDSGLPNLLAPILLDVQGEWPRQQYDVIYSANALHIMAAPAVVKCIEAAGLCLKPDGVLIVYGPFNYAGEYTSASNARFDAFLKTQNPASGIRDFEWLDELASRAGLVLLDDVSMPANNHSLIWQKRTL